MKYLLYLTFILLIASSLTTPLEARKDKGDPLNDPVSKGAGIVIYPTPQGD